MTESFIQSYNYDTNDKGYVLEVDIDYPVELHDSHNDYPLASEHKVIDKIKKLTPYLHDKKNYVLHIANLQYYLSMGMILKNMHMVIEFNHNDWLAKYICKTKYKMSPSSVRSEGGEAAAGYCLNSVSYRVDEAVKYNVLNSD